MVEAGRVGIVAALAAEARTLGAALERPGGLRSLADGSLLAVSGMGFEAAERAARAVVDAGCRALVSWGLAGGLDPRLSAGAVIVPQVLMLEGAPDLQAHRIWRQRVLDVLGAGAGGKLLTSRNPLASVAEKRKALLDSGACAVEMESYAIAAVAAAHGLPFIAIRVIVDAAGDEVPVAVLEAADARGRLAPGRLLVRMLGSPRSVALLPGLAHRYAVARRALRAAARAGAPGQVPVEAG